MARKKTKKQKQKTTKLRLGKPKVNPKTGSITEYTLTIDDSKPNKKTKNLQISKKQPITDTSLLNYDAKLLRGDLGRTVLMSLAVFAGEIGLFFYLR